MGRFDWVTKVARLVLIITLILIAIAMALTASLGVGNYMQTGQRAALLSFGVGVIAELIVAGCAVICYGLVVMLVAAGQAADVAAARIGRVESLMDDMAKSSRKLVDLDCLSDQARSIIYRDREIEAVREAVQDDLMRQDYTAAEDLIASVATRPGLAAEAAKLRDEVIASRKATLDEKIELNIARIMECVDHHDWARAIRESQRMIEAFPDSQKVKALPTRIENARTTHKRTLLEAYGAAVGKNDIDRSIELLRELDRYLTPQEAAALEESARGVFRAKLHSLGVQFAIKVNDSLWAEAVAVGEEIMRDFPNTRMAQEVRQKTDMLKARAAAKRQSTQQ